MTYILKKAIRGGGDFEKIPPFTMSASDRFKIIRPLGLGGMARLDLAQERIMSGITRLVVLKRLSTKRRSDPRYITMLQDEGRLLGQLTHPGVIRLLGAGYDHDEPYLALEYIHGTNLKDLLATFAGEAKAIIMPPSISLFIALHVAETLTAVHRAIDRRGAPLHVVHRDLTPSNVVLGYDGTVKVIDFGIAKGENRVYETSSGVVKGTCGYMSPEQAFPRSGMSVDHRADIFSFGVILYEMLVGRHPFAAATPIELYDHIVEATYDPPRGPAVSVRLAGLIKACLARNPHSRPRDMFSVASTIRSELLTLGEWPLAIEFGAFLQHHVPPNPHKIEHESIHETRGGIEKPKEKLHTEDWVTEIKD